MLYWRYVYIFTYAFITLLCFYTYLVSFFMASNTRQNPRRGSRTSGSTSTIRRSTSAGGSDGGGAESNADVEDEEEVFVPIRITNGHLRVTFPFHCPVSCAIENCKVQFKAKTWTSCLNSITKHNRDIHKFIPNGRSNWCGLCNIDLGSRIAHHACFKERPYFVQDKTKLESKCNICGEEYPTYREKALIFCSPLKLTISRFYTIDSINNPPDILRIFQEKYQIIPIIITRIWQYVDTIYTI